MAWQAIDRLSLVIKVSLRKVGKSARFIVYLLGSLLPPGLSYVEGRLFQSLQAMFTKAGFYTFVYGTRVGDAKAPPFLKQRSSSLFIILTIALASK